MNYSSRMIVLLMLSLVTLHTFLSASCLSQGTTSAGQSDADNSCAASSDLIIRSATPSLRRFESRSDGKGRILSIGNSIMCKFRMGRAEHELFVLSLSCSARRCRAG